MGPRPGGDLRLCDLDESEVLARILPRFGPAPGLLVGPGDDAAVVASASGSVVATTDSMVRGRDWRDDWSSAADVGVKLVAQNVADIAAMGAVPTGLLVSLMADPDTPVRWVEGLADGIAQSARDAGCAVIGGDLSSAPPGVLAVSMTALGDLQGRAPVLRSGAREGDVVAVCGGLGWSGAGLVTYAAGLAEPVLSRHSSPQDKAVSLVRWYHRSPCPPWGSGAVASRAGATAMLDISDGLVRDGGRIAAASGVSVMLSGDLLRQHFLCPPLTDALEADEAWRQILSGGEEHSLLATFPEGQVPVDERAPWWVIGRCVAPGADGPVVTVDGVRPEVSGWDHFHP